MIPPDVIEGVLNLAAQAVAAGFGAWAAFRLEAARQARDAIAAQADSLREALFTLISQRNFLLNLDREVLQEHRSSPIRHLELPPLAINPGYQPLQLAKLTFLLKSKKSGLISELELADFRFQAVVSVLDRRNRLHLEMQSRIDASRPTGPEIPVDALPGIVGRSVITQLRQTTDGLYELNASALATNRETYDALASFLRATFPKEPIPLVEERAPQGSLPSAAG